MAGIAIPVAGGDVLGAGLGLAANATKEPVKVDKEKLREARRKLYRRVLSGDYQLTPTQKQDNAIVEALSGRKEDHLGARGVDKADVEKIKRETAKMGSEPNPFYDPDNDPDKEKEEKRKAKDKELKPTSDEEKKWARKDEAAEGRKRWGKEIEDPDFDPVEERINRKVENIRKRELNENSRLDPDAYKKQQIKDKIEMNKGRPKEEWVRDDRRVENSKVNRSAAGEEISYKPEQLLEHKRDPENPTDASHIKNDEMLRAGLKRITKRLGVLLGVGGAAAGAEKAEAEEISDKNQKAISELSDDEKMELLEMLKDGYQAVTSDDKASQEYGHQLLKDIQAEYGLDYDDVKEETEEKEEPKEDTKKKEKIITGDRKKDFLGL